MAESEEMEEKVPITEWPVRPRSPIQCKYGVFPSCQEDNKLKSLKRTHPGDNGSDLISDFPEKSKKVLKSLDIVTADIALARWWRRHGRRLISPAKLPNSTNPNTILNFVQRTDIARQFLEGEVDKLKAISEERLGDFSPEQSSQIHTSLASFQDKLGRWNEARQQLDTALLSDIQAKDAQWLSAKVDLEIRMRDVQKQHSQRLGETPAVFPECKPVVRRSCKDLSFREFFSDYCQTGTPVIITDYLPLMTATPWTFQHVKEKAGNCTVTLKATVTESVEWARLESGRTTTVAEFIDGLTDGTEKEMCLFDWSLPIHCPELAQELTIPRYFAGDFLQRTSAGSLYKDSWPSLFMAPKGVTTQLHVDAFGSNFWMALFHGRKRWLFFPREDQALLYPQYTHSLDPVFEADLDPPDPNKFPLLSLTGPVECVLQPGELLFVPAGCPHRVENLDTSLAISANFVDRSNFVTVKEQLRINALIDPRAGDLLQQFNSGGFDSDMNFNVKDMPWEHFKQSSPTPRLQPDVSSPCKTVSD